MFRLDLDFLPRFLIISGWAILLFYFPSGWLHHTMGAYVYLRDILLALHLFSSCVYLQKQGQLTSYLSKAWLLGLTPLFLLPALFIPESRVEIGGYIKWSFIWFDCIILGRLISQHFTWRASTRVMALLSSMVLLADLGTGFYEWKNNTFVFPMHGQLSPMGVEMGKDSTLKSFKRVKGLQRDVFSFANLMGMAIVASICVFVSVERTGVRTLSALSIALFCFMLYNSGGRSAFLGVGAAGLIGMCLVFNPETSRRHLSKVAAVWLIIGLTISFIGIGAFTEWFSSHTLKDSHIGDATSAYMRDDNWEGVRNAIAHVPIVLFTGSPLGSMIDPRVLPIFHWADNNYLWLLYHGSFISLAGLIFYFRNVLARPIPTSRLWSKDCLLLFLLYVMGEAMARESLSFLGCMPLFIACGYVNGIRASSSRDGRNSRTRASQSISDTFAARVARRTHRPPEI